MRSLSKKVSRFACVKSLALLCVIAVLLSPLAFLGCSNAQEPIAATTRSDQAELHQAVLDLTNPATVMCVAAHPDDEDGTTLTVLRRKYGIHTVSLFSTYGEGGQNAVGPELYEDLGAIRARETMEAAQIQGSEPHFLGLRDFGFSKSAAEAFSVWGRGEALRRMVLKIRELRPDVIITNHDTTSGHGHHQATGLLVLEAFDAAADAKRFPDQLASVSVWQTSRLFVRTRTQGGSVDAPAETAAPLDRFVTIDPNERDPLRGTIYAEQALAALQKHASQGPWPKSIAERLRGTATGTLPLIRYRLAREAIGATALPTDAKTFFDGLNTARSVPAYLAAPTIEGRALTAFVDQPDRVLNALIGWRRRAAPSASTGEDRRRTLLMTERADRALAVASGVTSAVASRSAVAVPGATTSFTMTISNTGARTVQIHTLSFAGWGEKVALEAAEQLSADTETISKFDRVVPPNAALTVPHSDHLHDGCVFGERVMADAEVEIDGAKFLVRAEQRLDVAPAVEIKSTSPAPFIRTPQTANQPLAFRIKLANNLTAPFKGSVRLQQPGSRAFAVERAITLGPLEKTEVTLQSDTLPVEIYARQRSGSKSAQQLKLTVEASDAETPVTGQVTEKTLNIVWSDARVAPGLSVAYLPSFDSTLEQSLAALGVSARRLGVENIQSDNLAGYNAIILDNRAYYAHPELIAANWRLLSYVREGGTLIVFYNKDTEWNPNPDRGRPQLAPYPIILGDSRITEEGAPVRFVQSRHPLLNYPNKISSADFDNWIQERGLNYPKEWDPHYVALFSSADKGEQPLLGGLLAARYGRGNYIYTSMVWYRQLRAGVPGAYRMLANMISFTATKPANR